MQLYFLSVVLLGKCVESARGSREIPRTVVSCVLSKCCVAANIIIKTNCQLTRKDNRFHPTIKVKGSEASGKTQRGTPSLSEPIRPGESTTLTCLSTLLVLVEGVRRLGLVEFSFIHLKV